MRYTTLIDAATLARRLDDPAWVVIDCRHDLAQPDAGRAAFENGHLPHARFAHLDQDLSGDKVSATGLFRGRHPLPEREAFIDTLRNWGINDQTQVVAYDAHGGIFAARLWWMLRWVGHDAVAVLDGGLPAWEAAGLPLTKETTTPPPGTISLLPSTVPAVTVGDVLAGLNAPKPPLIIDARAPDRFRGENETLDPIGGHIPGAQNRFFKNNLQPDGRFKPDYQLLTEFSALVAAPANTIMQCGSGVTACHNLLAMEVAGLPGAALYPGSWSEWCADPERPVESGRQ